MQLVTLVLLLPVFFRCRLESLHKLPLEIDELPDRHQNMVENGPVLKFLSGGRQLFVAQMPQQLLQPVLLCLRFIGFLHIPRQIADKPGNGPGLCRGT